MFKRIAVITLCLLFFAAGLSLRQNGFFNTFKNVNFSSSLTNNSKHYASFSQAEFYTGLLNPGAYEPIPNMAVGGIVSHHFYAERNIANFFLRLETQNIKTVVIIGPNHFNRGKGQVLTSRQAYSTPFGDLEPDLDTIEVLEKNNLAGIEEEPFTIEHSISSLVGFVKKVIPNVKFVPIIIKRNSNLSVARNLGERLAEILPKDSIVIASVDFSHHQDLRTTEANDIKNLDLLKNWRIDSLMEAEADSPQSLAAVMEYSQKLGGKNFIYENTNSARLSGSLDAQDITSYVFGYFLKN